MLGLCRITYKGDIIMSFEDAKYYISETKEFVSYDEFMNWYWKDSYFAMRESMVQEGE